MATGSAVDIADRTEFDQTPTSSVTDREYALRIGLPGLISTILIAISSVAVGWAPIGSGYWGDSIIGGFHEDSTRVAVFAVVLTVGICGLCATWLQLGWNLQQRKVASLRQQRWSLAIWCMPLLLVPPLFSRDVYSYFVQGKILGLGLDPFTVRPVEIGHWVEYGVDPLWANSPAPYGQFWLLLSQGVSAITGDDPYVAAILFRLIALVGLVLLVWSIPTLARSTGASAERATWLAALNPFTILLFISAIHNDALMVGLIAAGLALAIRKHPVWAVVVITLAVSVKPVAALALPIVGLIWVGGKYPIRELIKRWAQIAAITIAILVGLALISGTGLGWISVLVDPDQASARFSPSASVGYWIVSFLELIGVTDVSWIVTVTQVLGVLLGIAIAVWLWRSPRNREPIRALGLAFLLLVLFGPAWQSWYLLWSIALLACAVLTKIEIRLLVALSIVLTIYNIFAHVYDGALYI
ncbi:MAG: polyprenol phosphomannose-dependent alpha 1,6 mannosyltransferase MptB [Candidatus Nanopelagicales bacterium]